MASILVVGEPGTGKSRGIKNLDPKTTFVIKPNNKQLPFKGANKLYGKDAGNTFVTNDIEQAGKLIRKISLESKSIKTIVIEDLTHFFSARVMRDKEVSGFGKWMDLASDVFTAFIAVEAELRPDLNLIMIGHSTANQDAAGNFFIGLQTPGKLLENNIKIPSYFTYVLHTEVKESSGDTPIYSFLTNREGGKLAKSPEGCLPLHIENDYKKIFDLIETYQNG